jgi:two-component system cell cycle sensor histidine kinase/response regulator CckA
MMKMAMFEGRETILAVDDETFMLSLAYQMLTQYGYSVLTASSAKEALHLFESWPDVQVDVALVDIVMPGMNGADLALKLHEMRPTLPIIFMSAYSENPELRPPDWRSVIFIAKPFTSMALARKVREVLDGHHADPASTKS